MPRSLPANPSVRFLQLEAKDIVKAHKNGDAACCATLRYHYRFSRADDEEILKAEVTLQEAQHALSLDYGFKSWTDLTERAKALSASVASARDSVSVEGRRGDEERRANEARLRHAEKLEAIGTLAGGVAYDLNNVLDSIVGYTELSLQDIPEGSPTRNCLSEALKGADRAREMIRQLLVFSGKGKRREEPLAMAAVVREPIEILRSSLPPAIEIKQNIDSYAGLTMADPVQIHQVIMNLAANAVYAMAEGGVLTVGVTRADMGDRSAELGSHLGPGPHVKLTVSDTGHGIPPDAIERIFEPYYTTKELGQGTGMGLAVVHGIVKQHNGVIDVDSEVGKGTTFNLYFPVVEEASE